MTSNEKSTSAFIHISALCQYFIPFGNFILPLLIWGSKKDSSEFVNQNGKNVLNFQLSLFLFSFLLALIAIPVLIYLVVNSGTSFEFFNHNHNISFNNFKNASGLLVTLFSALFLFCMLKLSEFIFIIIAAVKASEGETYRYPLTLNFIK